MKFMKGNYKKWRTSRKFIYDIGKNID